MDHPIAISTSVPRTIGSRSKDNRWVIVAVVDPGLAPVGRLSDITTPAAD